MYQFFIEEEQVFDRCVTILGADFHHLSHAVRMKVGEEFRVSTKSGRSYYCTLAELLGDRAIGEIISEDKDSTELRGRISLFQGLPKSDKMEWIIQKSVELGVSEIIPVAMKHCVVKLDEKKSKGKTARWQGIAESAAKQSKRSIVPKVHEVMSFSEAVAYGKDLKVKLVPYENEGGFAPGRKLIQNIEGNDSVGIYIGPEGGFSQEEITLAGESMQTISLGKRILRTETAAIAMLSVLMFQMEQE